MSLLSILESTSLGRYLNITTLVYFIDENELTISVDYYLYRDDDEKLVFDYYIHNDSFFHLSSKSTSALDEDLRDGLYKHTGIWASAQNQLQKQLTKQK